MAASARADEGSLLSKPSSASPFPVPVRTPSTYTPHPTFQLPRGAGKHYQQQYADMYFARLAQLKPAVEQHAREAWADFEIAGERARRVERVLDVRQGELCWVVGTCYMEMGLKPNVLEDIGREHWIAAPPPREKYVTGAAGGDEIMLEDESGRLRLRGDVSAAAAAAAASSSGGVGGMMLVTGAIVAVVGTENRDGDFEVLDVKVPDLPRQPQRWETEDGEAALRGEKTVDQRQTAGKVAIVSGLDISGDEADTLKLHLLLEWLLGEAAGVDEQESTSSISRLIIAGNSISHGSPIPTREELAAAAASSAKNRGGARKYGYDSSAYNSLPTDRLDSILATLLPSIPVTLLPGATDPTSTQLPQQPLHPALFPHSRNYMEPPTSTRTSWLDSSTNPYSASIDGWLFLGTGGQPVDDIFRYTNPTSSSDSSEGTFRSEILESMLRWRLVAPTAPDTLPCYPFQDGDGFVLRECPHVFFAGAQPAFETGLVHGPAGQIVRIVAVPRFKETGEVVVLDMETLVPEIVKMEVFGEG